MPLSIPKRPALPPGAHPRLCPSAQPFSEGSERDAAPRPRRHRSAGRWQSAPRDLPRGGGSPRWVMFYRCFAGRGGCATAARRLRGRCGALWRPAAGAASRLEEASLKAAGHRGSGGDRDVPALVAACFRGPGLGGARGGLLGQRRLRGALRSIAGRRAKPWLWGC